MCLAAVAVAQAVCAQSGAPAASTARDVQALKTLQSIKPGLWQLSTSVLPERSVPPPEEGCITPQALADDLREFLAQDQEGRACHGAVVEDEQLRSVLQVSCSSAGENAGVFKAPPAVLEITRISPEKFTVKSTMSAPQKPTLVMTQDYQYLGACPL